MPDVTRNLSIALEASPGCVANARARLADFAAGVGASDEQVDAVRLVVSEAVTNAVLHAYRGGPGAIQLTAAVTGQELWILVADDGDGLRPVADRPGLGLGLVLIAQASDRMSIVPRSSGGTEVRIVLDLSVAGGGDPRDADPAPAVVAAPAR